MISALHSKYENYYVTCTTCKDLWDALDAKFGVSDAGSKLYIMEQLFDYKMVDNRSVVEQAHEIQALAKELKQFPCVLSDKLLADGIYRQAATFLEGFCYLPKTQETRV